MWPGPGLGHKLAHEAARRRSTKGPRPFKEEARKAQSVKRISFSLQTLNASVSLFPPPSKVAATETVQPFIFGSLMLARASGASGFESVVVLSPAVITTPVTVFALAFTTVTAPGGPFRFGLGFGAAASGEAAAPTGAEPDTVGEGAPTMVCAAAGVRPATRAAHVSPAMREKRMGDPSGRITAKLGPGTQFGAGEACSRP